jgi:hypothetical protein
MSGVRIALIVALGGVAIALLVVMSGSPPTLTRASAPLAGYTELNTIAAPARLCQGDEVLPAGTTAVRISLEALIGPSVTLAASADGHLLTSGRRATGWSNGSVTIPVAPLTRSYSHVTICAQIARPRKPLGVDGVRTAPAVAARDAAGQPVAGRLLVEYLRPGKTSWWSLVRSVARRMGLGHAWGGTGIALLAAAMMAALATLMSWVLLRELR